jgi:sec-independent protein translocase protein TatA
MEFFNIGPVELILILVVALIVFGPRQLPEIGASLGKALREFRQMSQGVTGELKRELQATQEAAQVNPPAPSSTALTELSHGNSKNDTNND